MIVYAICVRCYSKKLWISLHIFFIFSHASLVEAATPYFSTFTLWPQLSKSYFATSSSEALSSGDYLLGVSNQFIYHPLQQLVLPSGANRSIISYAMGHFILADVGLTDSWQIGFTLPIFSRAKFETPSAISSGAETVSRLGDLRLLTKFQLLDLEQHPVGLALEPFMTIPLAAEDVYLGESSLTGGFKGIAEYALMPQLRVALNLGLEIRDHIQINNLDFRHLFLSGVGLSADVTPHLIASAEVQSSTPLNHFFSEGESTPVEFIGGLQWKIGETGFILGAGAGTCAVCGIRAPSARAFLNIAYRSNNTRNISPSVLPPVLFETGKSRVSRKESSRLKEDVKKIRLSKKQKIIIEGHTDSLGSEDYNLRLSVLRAKHVYRLLLDYGIDERLLEYQGYGERSPVFDNTTKEGRRKNRRVNILIETPRH